MNYSPIFLRTENELNKVLRKQKRSKQDLGVLFTSLWDENSDRLVGILEDEMHYPDNAKKKPLYIVDSFKMPHAFVIFKTTKVPHLIQFKKGSVESEDYLVKIYEELGL